MRKTKIIKLISILIPLILVSCGTTPTQVDPTPTIVEYTKDADNFYVLDDKYIKEDRKSLENVYIPEVIENQPTVTNLKMFVGDKQVPIYNVKTNFSHTWNGETQTRMNNGVCTIGIKGEVEIFLQTNFAINNVVKIRPLSKNVDYTLYNDINALSFKIKETGQYTIEFRNDRTLHLFVNNYDKMDAEYKNQNFIIFEPGIHTHENDPRINKKNEIILESNQTIYIHPSAVVNAKFYALEKSNIKIFGCGYISGENFVRSSKTGQATVPIDFNFCNNVTLEDFSIIDPAAWVFNMCWCRDSSIKNCKVISSRSNGDGISLQSCANFSVEDCFIRSWDDSLVVKNYKDWRNGTLGSTDTIKFKNCIIWTDLAQSMEIGYETVGEHLENVSFENIIVLHNFHKPVFSIHNGNQANIKNVSYKNIIVEDASMGKGDGSPILLEFVNTYSSTWSNQYGQYPIGEIDGVTIENVEVLDGISNPSLIIKGFEEFRDNFPKKTSLVKNVKISNFKLYGKLITKDDFSITLAENIEAN